MGQKLVPRKVLALYKGSENRTEEVNEIYQRTQIFLNNLGLVVEYTDAEKPLPNSEKMAEYRGVLTWFVGEQMKNVSRYRSWLHRILTENNLPVAILGQMGAYREFGREMSRSDQLESDLIFSDLGLKSSYEMWQSDQIKIAVKDTAFFDYECTLTPGDIRTIEDVVSVDSTNRVLIELTLNGVHNSAAVLCRRGVYLQDEVLYHQYDDGYTQWFVNPTKIFARVFSCDQLPRIDINTLGGKRTAFIHIDGDGFSTISKIDRWHLCAQLMQTRIINKFPLPYSVSVIAAEIDSAYMGNEETVTTAQKLFRSPNVEPASHGFAHPFDWRTGKLELDSIPDYTFDPQMEINGAIHYIQNNLLPPDKSINLFFWSGMCNPTSEQIDLTQRLHILQINGDAGRLNPKEPSLSSFAPPYAQTKNQFRINARISNEFEFTNLWHGPYNGYRDVIHSIRFTEKTCFMPVDLYFHFYSMEFSESAKALQKVIRFAAHQDWNFLYTSQYVQLARDFLTAKIYTSGQQEYRVIANGFVRTVRLPGVTGNINLQQSRHILGFVRQNGDLIVHLDDQPQHKIIVSQSRPNKPYLQTFNRMVHAYTVESDTIKMRVFGYGNFKVQLQNMLPNQAYEITQFTGLSAGEYEKGGYSPRQFDPIQGKSAVFAKSKKDGSLMVKTFIRNRTVLHIYPVSSRKKLFANFKLIFLGLILTGFFGGQIVLFKRKGNKSSTN